MPLPSEQASTASTVRWKTISFWVLRIVFAAFLVLASGMKLAGTQQMVQVFDTIDIGQWFRIVTGLVELVTAVLLLVSATVGIGALLGFGVMVGATFSNIFILHHDFIHSTVPAIIFAMIAWAYRSQLPKLVG